MVFWTDFDFARLNLSVENNAFSSEAADGIKKKTQLILDAVDRLSKQQRAVFNLYVREGYDHEEIAQILDISQNVSTTTLSRAKKRIRQLVEKSLSEPYQCQLS